MSRTISPQPLPNCPYRQERNCGSEYDVRQQEAVIKIPCRQWRNARIRRESLAGHVKMISQIARQERDAHEKRGQHYISMCLFPPGLDQHEAHQKQQGGQSIERNVDVR